MALQACCVGKKPDDFVFTRARFSFKDRNRRMRPVGDFRKLWRSIVSKAGIERDVLLHDFRRSAVMNMVQAGVDRKVIREYTGHATDSMHDRYHILRNEQVVEAARMNEQRKLSMLNNRRRLSQVGQNWATANWPRFAMIGKLL